MEHIFTANIGSDERKVFIEEENVNSPSMIETSLLHNHRYTEVHVVVNGKVRYAFEETVLILEKGSMIGIPPKLFHQTRNMGQAQYITFQIDYPIGQVVRGELEPVLLEEFFSLMSLNRNQDVISRVVPHIILICSRLFPDMRFPVKEETDNGFLIYEFFSRRYGENVSLLDLAKKLHLSEKQTQRVVQRLTGHSFLKELTQRRMKVARKLEREGEMSLQEIAQYVGYRSYSGFWKARNTTENRLSDHK